MSELKAFNSSRIYWAVEQVERVAGDIDTLHLDDSQFYLKSEADKVIANKNKEIAELKEKIEDAKATAYTESVDAGMRERRLKRALYKACANWAKSEWYTEATWHGDKHRELLWASVHAKCLAKTEEYK